MQPRTRSLKNLNYALCSETYSESLVESGCSRKVPGLAPSWEGQKPKASGWVLSTKNPPRRSATAVAARHPSREGISRPAAESRAKFRYYRFWSCSQDSEKFPRNGAKIRLSLSTSTNLRSDFHCCVIVSKKARDEVPS